jgi:signal-transduction protein with cAMP-binding, CBS, and nucleotidyltransferase domain
VRLDEIKFSEVFAHCPLFSTLTPQEIIDIRMKAKEKSYPKGAPLFRKDSQLKVATIIISGSVREQFKDEYGKFYLIRSVGSVLDAYDFTYKEAAKCEAKARNNIRVLEI